MSELTIPASPQAARPAVSERGIGPGGVSGCSAMPGAWRSQPAPGKARGIRGQDTVERHGGLDVVMEKIVQWEQETPATNGRRMIDDFRLRGSRTCRRRGGPLTKGGWRTEVAHVAARPFNHPNAPLSEGEALAVVVQVVPGNPHWTRVGTDCPSPMGLSPVRRRHRVSPPRMARRGAAREREMVVRATPSFSALVRHGGGQRGTGVWPPVASPFSGSLSPQGSLAGRPLDVQSRSRWMSVAACCFVTFLLLDVLLCI